MSAFIPTGRFLLDGRTFVPEEIRDYSSRMEHNESLPAWKRELFAFIHLFLDDAGEEIIQSTSGTTGDPGEVPLKRSSMIRSAETTLDFFHLRPGDRILLCLPVHYIAGKMMVVRALVGGLHLITTEPASRPLKEVSGSFRFAAMVPLQVYESLRNEDPLSDLDQLVIGGGELPSSVREKLEKAERPAVYESFAMTETCSHFALKRINGKRPDRHFRLLEGVRIWKDERGCLVVEVPGVTTGKIITSDLVEITGGGNGFQWLGRMDNVIKSGGVKIIPEVLEQRIGHLLNRTCLILPEKDPRLGQRIVLLVETRNQPASPETWEELLRQYLPEHELPRRIVTVREIPRNPSFKPDRKAAVSLLSSEY